MALTVTPIRRTAHGNRREVIADILWDSSYPTGGESLTPANLGLTVIEQVTFDGAGGYTTPYDRTNQKLMAYNGTTQVANTTDLSAVTTRIRALGQ